jgi:hypothetical protein
MRRGATTGVRSETEAHSLSARNFPQYNIERILRYLPPQMFGRRYLESTEITPELEDKQLLYLFLGCAERRMVTFQRELHEFAASLQRVVFLSSLQSAI